MALGEGDRGARSQDWVTHGVGLWARGFVGRDKRYEVTGLPQSVGNRGAEENVCEKANERWRNSSQRKD